MATIDLATYSIDIKVNNEGVKQGMSEADKTVEGGLKGLVQKSGLAQKALSVGIGAMAVKVGKESVQAFASVEQEMNKVFTLLPPMSEDAKNKMTKQARDLSKEVGKLPEEVIPAVYSALSAGVPEENVFDYVETASKMAVAGGAEVEESVEGLASVLNAYNMDASEAEKISDMFFMTLKNGMTSVPELSASLSNVTPLAAAMGIEFEEVAGALATMTAQGIPTSQATNQIKGMLAELNKEGSVASDVFTEIAGKSFPEFIEQGGSLQEALQMMDKHAEDSNTTISNLFGSMNAGQGALALTGENAQSFAEDIEAMGNSAGATEDAFQEMNQGINRTKDVIEVMTNDIKVSIGEMLAPLLSIFYTAVLAGLKVLEVAVEGLSKVVGVVVDFIMERVEKMKTRMEKFAKENEKVLTSISDTVKRITDLVVKIVGTVLETLGKVLDAFHDGAENGTQTTWEAILKIIDTVLKLIEGVLEVFSKAFQGDWSGMWEAIKKIVSLAWDAIKAVVSGALKAIVGILKGMIGGFLGASKELFGAIWNGAKDIMKKLLSWITTPIKNILKAFTSKYSEARSAGRGMFSAVWEGMKGIWSSLSNWVSSKVQWLSDKLKFWDRGSKKMAGGGGGGGGTGARAFAVGTPFVSHDQTALIHEGEAIIPKRYNPFTKGGHFKPEFGFGGGENNYNVQIDIDNVDSGIDIERAVQNGIERAENKRKRNLKKKGI